MASRQEQIICAKVYRHKSKLNNLRKARAYEQWLQEYLPFAEELYQMVINSVKGKNPDFDTFCQFLYKSYECGFDPHYIKLAK